MYSKEVKYRKQQDKTGTPIRLAAYFSSETMQARMQWGSIFKVLDKIIKIKNLISSKNISG